MISATAQKTGHYSPTETQSVAEPLLNPCVHILRDKSDIILSTCCTASQSPGAGAVPRELNSIHQTWVWTCRQLNINRVTLQHRCLKHTSEILYIYIYIYIYSCVSADSRWVKQVFYWIEWKLYFFSDTHTHAHTHAHTHTSSPSLPHSHFLSYLNQPSWFAVIRLLICFSSSQRLHLCLCVSVCVCVCVPAGGVGWCGCSWSGVLLLVTSWNPCDRMATC